MEKEDRPKRRGTRFTPDVGTMAGISYHSLGPDFTAQYAGLVLSESAHGCSIVHVGAFLKVGDVITIKVGDLAPSTAEVRWVTQLDDTIQKVGFQYVEGLDIVED